MAADAEIKIEEEHLSAVGILAQYTRLKQFANARHKVKQDGQRDHGGPAHDRVGQARPRSCESSTRTVSSMRRSDESWGDEQIVIGSQFSSFVDTICDWLNRERHLSREDHGRGHEQGARGAHQASSSPVAFKVLVVSTKAGWRGDHAGQRQHGYHHG
jgi:hypothetical protein